jgi:hypothetical protein
MGATAEMAATEEPAGSEVSAVKVEPVPAARSDCRERQ